METVRAFYPKRVCRDLVQLRYIANCLEDLDTLRDFPANQRLEVLQIQTWDRNRQMYKDKVWQGDVSRRAREIVSRPRSELETSRPLRNPGCMYCGLCPSFSLREYGPGGWSWRKFPTGGDTVAWGHSLGKDRGCEDGRCQMDVMKTVPRYSAAWQGITYLAWFHLDFPPVSIPAGLIHNTWASSM